MSIQTKLTEFREQLYTAFPARRDALMDLLDALCSSTQARSVVELSLEPAFRRGYSSLHDAVDTFFTPSSPHMEWAERSELERSFRRAVAGILEPPGEMGWWHLTLDTLPLSRPHAHRLGDRGWVYQPEVVPGKAPVTIGHRYSLLAALPVRSDQDPAWTVPLSLRRVPTESSGLRVGLDQVRATLDDPELPWYEQPVVLTADSGYAQAPFLAPLADWERLIIVTRLRSNRVLYRIPPPRTAGQRGRTRLYGEPFKLRDRRTWHEPDTVTHVPQPGNAGDVLQIQAWHSMLMKGSKGAPMHDAPFTLLRCVVVTADGGLRPRTLKWIIVLGRDRHTLMPEAEAEAYRRRFDIEHGIRFGKQRLHLGDYQTCETEHEENWLTLVGLAMAQLYAARDLAQALPRPWEPRRSEMSTRPPTPSMVQRDFGRILAAIGTPACQPKPRGNSVGRSLGQCPGHRLRSPVIKKTRSRRQNARAPALSAI